MLSDVMEEPSPKAKFPLTLLMLKWRKWITRFGECRYPQQIYSNVCFKTDNWTLLNKSMLLNLRTWKCTLTSNVPSVSKRHKDQVSGKLVPKIPRLRTWKSGVMLSASSLLSHILKITAMDMALNGKDKCGSLLSLLTGEVAGVIEVLWDSFFCYCKTEVDNYHIQLPRWWTI